MSAPTVTVGTAIQHVEDGRWVKTGTVIAFTPAGEAVIQWSERRRNRAAVSRIVKGAPGSQWTGLWMISKNDDLTAKVASDQRAQYRRMAREDASPRRSVCAYCGKPGTVGDPLLHATKGGTAHNRCDRP